MVEREFALNFNEDDINNWNYKEVDYFRHL